MTSQRLTGSSPDQLPRPRRPHRAGEGVDVVGAVVAFLVDEEGRGAGDAAEVGGSRRPLRSAPCWPSSCSSWVEALEVEVEFARVARRSAGPELALVVEQQVVHLPEPPLRGRRLGGLGRELRRGGGRRRGAGGARERRSPSWRAARAHRLRAPAVGALEFAVIHECDRSVSRAAAGGPGRGRPGRRDR